jgi:hypothetical protein
MVSYDPFDMRIHQIGHKWGANTLKPRLYPKEANLRANIVKHAFKALQGELGTM